MTRLSATETQTVPSLLFPDDALCSTQYQNLSFFLTRGFLCLSWNVLKYDFTALWVNTLIRLCIKLIGVQYN